MGGSVVIVNDTQRVGPLNKLAENFYESPEEIGKSVKQINTRNSHEAALWVDNELERGEEEEVEVEQADGQENINEESEKQRKENLVNQLEEDWRGY